MTEEEAREIAGKLGVEAKAALREGRQGVMAGVAELYQHGLLRAVRSERMVGEHVVILDVLTDAGRAVFAILEQDKP